MVSQYPVSADMQASPIASKSTKSRPQATSGSGEQTRTSSSKASDSQPSSFDRELQQSAKTQSSGGSEKASQSASADQSNASPDMAQSQNDASSQIAAAQGNDPSSPATVPSGALELLQRLNTAQQPNQDKVGGENPEGRKTGSAAAGTNLSSANEAQLSSNDPINDGLKASGSPAPAPVQSKATDKLASEGNKASGQNTNIGKATSRGQTIPTLTTMAPPSVDATHQNIDPNTSASYQQTASAGTDKAASATPNQPKEGDQVPADKPIEINLAKGNQSGAQINNSGAQTSDAVVGLQANQQKSGNPSLEQQGNDKIASVAISGANATANDGQEQPIKAVEGNKPEAVVKATINDGATAAPEQDQSSAGAEKAVSVQGQTSPQTANAEIVIESTKAASAAKQPSQSAPVGQSVNPGQQVVSDQQTQQSTKQDGQQASNTATELPADEAPTSDKPDVKTNALAERPNSALQAPKGDTFSKLMAQLKQANENMPQSGFGELDLASKQDSGNTAMPAAQESATVRLTGMEALTKNGALPSQASLANSQALAAQISRHAQKGETRFEIRLDPAELGKVDVRLTIGSDGQTRAHLFVERSETLDYLMRDQRVLERALQQSGLDLEKQGLEFSLMDQNSQQQFAQQFGQQEGHGDGTNFSQDTTATDQPQSSEEQSSSAGGTYLATNGVNMVV